MIVLHALASLIATGALHADIDVKNSARFGSVISSEGMIRCSSTSPRDEPEYHLSLLGDGHEPCAFHTAEEDRPWVQIDLGRVKQVTALTIRNRTDGQAVRATALAVSLSNDGAAWNEVITVDGPQPEWAISLLDGENPRGARYVRITLPSRGFLHLSRVQVYERGGAS